MMKFLVIIFAILATARGAAISRPMAPELENRIMGGKPIEIVDAPFQISFLLIHITEGTWTLVCSGSIITNTVILTAAHCVHGTNPSQHKIRAGSTYYTTGGQFIDVARYTIHPNYSTWDLSNNIALVNLRAAIFFTNGASPVNLPYPGQTVADNSLGSISGWGSASTGGEHTRELYQATVPIVNQDVCNSIFTVTDDMICAGWLGVGGQDTCSGDGGAPLIVDKVLIGIASWGYSCGTPEYPGVYTRVPMFVNWINSNL